MISRRHFIKTLTGLGLLSALDPYAALAASPSIITRAIPSTGEQIPVIGMGSWLTFDVAYNEQRMATRVQVLQEFFDRGGALIDSSPMYGSSEMVIGHCLNQIKNKQALFSATKVWTQGQRQGVKQMQASREKWGVDRFDLMQVHNMVDWETHLETLKAWKTEGRIRYIGITTSHGRRHRDLERALSNEAFDFVQFTYNVLDREVEQRLLPLAAERGIAVIINRPFQRGSLFSQVNGEPLPAWASDIDCANWAQFFLKFIVSHPAVTCAIPATSRVEHMAENMGAAYGRLPDARMRQRMTQYVENL